MTTTIREQIMQAAIAALNGPERPAGVPEATRAHAAAANATQLPKIAITPVNESVERIGLSSAIKRTLTLRVECQAAGQVGSDEPADALLDAITAWCTKALAFNRLGGLANNVEEVGIDWATNLADYAYCAAVIDYQVTYQTYANDQTRVH